MNFRLPRTPPSLKLLLAGTVSALNTANAYRPIGERLPPAVTLSGPAAMMTTELPLQTIAAQQVATLVFRMQVREAYSTSQEIR